MTAAKVVLTRSEKAALHECRTHGDAYPVIESIAAAKIAEALREARHELLNLLVTEHLPDGVEEHPEGCCDICDWVGCLQDEHLLALADSYDGGVS